MSSPGVPMKRKPKQRPTSAREKEIQGLIERIVLLKADLGRAALYRTMHAMELAVKEVGYEVANELYALRARSAPKSPDRKGEKHD